MFETGTAMKLKEFDELNDELDFLFNNYFKSKIAVLMPMERGWKPLTDMFETKSEIVIVMDIAGISQRDIKLQLQNNILVIRGIRRERLSGDKRKYHKMEIDFGPFERRIELPSNVDPEGVTANYSQGFLKIKLPKVEIAHLKRHEIKIL